MNAPTQAAPLQLKHWTLDWAHGALSVQALGGMLAPVSFKLANGNTVSPLQVTPWQADPALPGILRGLRGSWPCLPFGMTQAPAGLPAHWQTHAADNQWDHGFAANHEWQRLAQDEFSLTIGIDLPETEAIAHLSQTIRVDPNAAALEVTLQVAARREITLPFALHPTFAVPAAGGVEVVGCDFESIQTYPVPQEPGVSMIQPNQRASSLAQLPAVGGHMDVTHLPLPFKTEELFQLQACKPPFLLRYAAAGATVALDWDAEILPDALVWISNAGRDYAPWNGRHYAIGIEPANSFYDLGRVVNPPKDHALAARRGLHFTPDKRVHISWRLSAV